MAKAPIPGLSKTRLIPDLGSQATALLARRMFLHSINTAIEANLGTVECCVVPDHDNPVWSQFKRDFSIEWSSQVEGDLGQRMGHVAERISKLGQKIILIGTDCPMLTPNHLRFAAQWLEHGDVSMIPVADGGYCLLALKQFNPAIFDDVSWSTSTVAEKTRHNCSVLGWQLAELDTLHDIDR
ncbi:MAG: TIGR04282 family arsenosugar biosynthesis glycosyltransferase, partial [Gammaproteobacteria bacterium]|nr:TIGR04282 family arsenosugar biosynthesis glycosyltransferase [Gammaproteobacteria bacterium]